MVTFDNYEEPKYSINTGKGVIIGSTEVMLNLFQYLNALAGLPTTVLLCGETGTGKELFARALHYNTNGAVKRTNFVAVNCAGIPSELLESELFGYVKGSFTGAYRDTVGKFQHANKGTILLDEIGDMGLSLQAKILRVLQERQVTRVGSAKAEDVDVRVIAATNKNLEELVEKGKFREDLYYRINVLPVTIPPLRERTDDIPLIADYLIERYNRIYGATVEGISPTAVEKLKNSKWKGNIRELENVIERVFVSMRGGTVKADHLSFKPEMPCIRAVEAVRNRVGNNPITEEVGDVIDESSREAGMDKAWYQNGVFPIVHKRYLRNLEGSKSLSTIKKLLHEGKIYVERVNPHTQTILHLFYLTPENVGLFFRDRGTDDYRTLEQEIRNGKFNTLVHSPFKFFGSAEIISTDKYLSFTLGAIKLAAKKAQVYQAPSRKDYYFALTEDNVGDFITIALGSSEPLFREAKIQEFREKIRSSYDAFRRWKPRQSIF